MPAETQAAGAADVSLPSIGLAGASSDTLTEDQLLDQPSESAPEVAEPEVQADETVNDGAAADAGKVEGADGQAAKDAAAAAADNLPSSLPKELSALLKDPSVAPKLQAVMPQIQSAFDQLRTIREVFPTTRAVREFSEAFPGGVEEAKAAQSKATILDAADDEFSGSPEAQRGLAQEWNTDNPEAFKSMFVQSAAVLRESDPEAYQQITNQVFVDRLAQIGFDEQIEGFRQVLASGDVEKLKGLTQWMVNEADRLGIKWSKATGQVDPAQAAISREREAAAADRSAATQERIEIFQNQVGNAVENSVKQTIAAAINEPLKASAFSEQGKEAIRADIRSKVDSAIKADKGMQKQIGRILQEGLRTKNMNDARTKVVALLTQRAKQLIPKTAQGVIAEKTAQFIAQNKDLNTRRDAAGARRDVGTGGAPPAIRTRKLTKDDTAGMTDDDIMNA